MKPLAILLCCLAAAWARPPRPSRATADNAVWPRFHGPNGDNISPEAGLLPRWPADGPPVAWQAKGIGEGFSSVTIGGGRIYTAGNVGGKTTITALDLDGHILWQVESGEGWDDGRFPGARSTPTLDGRQLYHLSPGGQLACFDAQTGKRLWTLNLVDRFGGKLPKWGAAESVLVDGDRLICCPGGQTAVVALDKNTGKTLWRSPSHNGDAAGYASPVIVEQQGLRIVLTMTSEGLLGVDARDGRILFFFEHQQGEYRVNALTPLYHDGQVFISSGYGVVGSVMLRITVEADRAALSKVWESKQLDNHHGGVVLVDDCLYGASHNFNYGKWICLDWKTGEMRYADKGVGKGSLTVADGRLYTLAETGRVGLVEATPREHRLVGQFHLPRGGRGKSWAHPVVCGGRLYLRHGDFLYAYEVKDKDATR